MKTKSIQIEKRQGKVYLNGKLALTRSSEKRIERLRRDMVVIEYRLDKRHGYSFYSGWWRKS